MRIKKVVIFYFSGTGNSKRIATWFSNFAPEHGIDCLTIDITRANVRTFKEIDSETLIGFISPVHGFSYPKIMLDFIRHFPKGKNNIFLMNTRAGMRIGRIVTPGLTGIGFFLSSFMLRRKGYRVVGQIPFDMPSNWISIHPALGGKSVKLIHEKNYQRVKEHVDKLCSGKKDFASRKDTIQDVLISPVAFAYYTIGRYFFAKSYYASPACTHCDLCIKQCPVQAIKKVDNRPFWTFKCESCMKCMNNCPTKAIETTHGIWIVAGILASSLCTYLFYSWLPIAIQSGFVKLLLFSLVLIALIGVFYRIQQLLLRSRFAGKLISLASLTRYKFWGRYRSIPDDR